MLFIKKSTFYTLFLALFLLGTSCNILDPKSPNDVAQEDVFKDADGLRSARIGMYASLQQRDYYGATFPLVLDAHTDNGATGGFDNIGLKEISDRHVTPSNLFVEQMWVAVYNVIAASNQILANVDKITGMDKIEQNDIKGEALFVRALCHFDALRTWGEHWKSSSEFGVPIITKVQTQKDVAARSSVAASYDAIIADLTAAEAIVADDNFATAAFKGQGYVTKKAVRALLARVYLYKGDKVNATKYANILINDTTFGLYDPSKINAVYTDRLSTESIFELIFDSQNRSSFNALTYSRPEALRTEVQFLLSASLDSFFIARPGDARANLVNFTNNDASIQPDGRTEKYRGEEKRDNPAYILRLAEMYLIAAEAKGKTAGLVDLNTLRAARGMEAIKAPLTDAQYADILSDERRAELNMEGNRYSDLARTGKTQSILGASVLGALPIPLREIGATGGKLTQFPGY